MWHFITNKTDVSRLQTCTIQSRKSSNISLLFLDLYFIQPNVSVTYICDIMRINAWHLKVTQPVYRACVAQSIWGFNWGLIRPGPRYYVPVYKSSSSSASVVWYYYSRGGKGLGALEIELGSGFRVTVKIHTTTHCSAQYHTNPNPYPKPWALILFLGHLFRYSGPEFNPIFNLFDYNFLDLHKLDSELILSLTFIATS